VDGPNHVLVVDSKFIAGGDTASLPAEVRAAVKAVLRKGGRVCTAQWLERFQAGGWREGVSAGFMREDVTDIYRKKFGIQVKRTEKVTNDDDSVIDLQSSGESESDDEVEVVKVKQPSKRLKTDGSEADADVKPATMTERQREMAERKKNRPANLRERPAFAATWLRNADGFKEAKVKANTLHTTYPKGESPEEIVLAKATAYMERVKSRSKKQWNFVFEACYQEQCKAKAASGEGGEETIGQQAHEVNESTDANSSSHFDVRARNIQIGKRIRDIFTAETVLNELERIRMGRKADKTQRATTDFRKIEYQRVARTVETYPIPVTLDCLRHPLKGVEYRGSLCEKLGVPRIQCSEDSTTRSRLIRSILYYDKPKDPRLKEDPRLNFILDEKKNGQAPTSHAKDVAMLENPDYKCIDELSQIWGMGLATAALFVSWGIGSVQDLRKDTEVFNTLNSQQTVGLKHYEDLIERIPRDEVKALADHVTAVVTKLGDGTVSVTCGGSYRRGAPSSGDVDMIFLPVDGAPDKAAVNIMEPLLIELRRTGFLTDDLAIPNQFGENNGKEPGTDSRSYMGVCRLPDRTDRKHRRIDLKAYPKCQEGTCLIYFTGDTHFNRSLRHFAKKAGLTLSDGGLSACTRRKTAQGWKRVQTDPSVRCQTEEDVFKALGLNYVEPIFRACHRLDKMKIRGGNRTWDNLIDMDESDLDDSGDEM